MEESDEVVHSVQKDKRSRRSPQSHPQRYRSKVHVANAEGFVKRIHAQPWEKRA